MNISSPESSSSSSGPVRFPTFQDLVLADQAPAPRKQHDKGLFKTLIGNPAVLHQDLLRSPAKYDERLLPLLQRLLVDPAELDRLSPNENELLNLAVYDYNRDLPSPRPVPPPSVTKQAEHAPESQPDEPLEIDGLKPYWWL